MNWARRWFAHLLGIILFLALLGTAYSISLNRTFGTAPKVENLLAESHVYDNVVSTVLSKTQQETEQGQGDSSVSYETPAVEQAATQAFSAAEIQKSVNTFIEANYDWLNGKTDQPSFAIDLTSSKDDFATKVGQAVTAHLSQLPACTAEQQTQLQVPVDPLTVSCRPAALNPQSEGARVTQEIKNGNFLTNSVIQPDTLGQDQNSQQQPYYKRLSSLPKLFQLAQKAPLILGLVSLLCALGIVVIAAARRRGWRKVGITLLLAGAVLIATKLVADTLVAKLENKIFDTSLTGTAQIAQSRTQFIHHVESQLTQTNLLFGAIYVILAIAILVYLFNTRSKSTRPRSDRTAPINESLAPETGQLTQPVNGEAADVRNRLRPPVSSQPPQSGRPGDTPERPRPPRPPRPPRLIQ